MWQDVDPDNMSYEVSIAMHSHVFLIKFHSIVLHGLLTCSYFLLRCYYSGENSQSHLVNVFTSSIQMLVFGIYLCRMG